MEKLNTGGDIFEFSAENNEFVGQYDGTTLNWERDDEKTGKKAGDIIGYNFNTRDNSDTITIGASYAVSKIMPKVQKGDIVSFRWLGKKEAASGRSVNRMEIVKWDSWKEFDLLAEEKESRQKAKDQNPQM